MFNTDYYNSRYFNHLSEEDGIMTKSSTNIEKIVAEYNYYYQLPADKRRFFVQPFDLIVSNDLASYKMEFIKHKNLAESFASGDVSSESFEILLDKIDELKHGTRKEDFRKSFSDAQYLVVEKTRMRLQGQEEYADRVDRISKAFDDMVGGRKTWNSVLSHGDLCFSNMIWVPEIEMLKLIDPRGAKVSEQLYMDEYYDLAKMSHSIFGGYESVIYSSPIDYSSIKDLFIDYLNYHAVSLDLIKLYEASLFLSMIPLHIDSKSNISKFTQICDDILESIGI